MTAAAGHSVLGALLATVLAMALRRGHGSGAGSPLRVEVPPADELRLPKGVAAPAPAPSGPVPRRPDGKVDGSEAARELGRRGGLAAARRRAQAEQFASRLRMHVPDLPIFEAHSAFAAYAEEAELAYAALLAQLGEQTDGVVSVAVSSIARSAITQSYQGRWLSDLGSGRPFAFVEVDGKPAPNATLLLQASRLAEASRQSLLACHHLQALESEARAKAKGGQDAPWFVDSGEKEDP